MKKIILSALLAATAFSVQAKPTAEQIKATIPGITDIVSVKDTPMKGLYEVITENSVFFVDDSLSHLFSGEMFDVKTKTSLTLPAIEKVRAQMAAKQQERMKSIINAVDKKSAVIEKKGTGAREVFIFTDPLCPFCKRLEGELAKMTDVTIYRLMTPFKGQASVDLVTSVLCSKDRLAAWNSVAAGKTVKAPTCEAPIEETMALAKTLGVKGTPTLFKTNGSRRDGAAPKEAIEAWLAE